MLISMSESKSLFGDYHEWHISGQGYKHLTDQYCSKLQLLLCKRLILSDASIILTEGLLIYIYLLLFEENRQNRISRAGGKIAPTISLFFVK